MGLIKIGKFECQGLCIVDFTMFISLIFLHVNKIFHGNQSSFCFLRYFISRKSIPILNGKFKFIDFGLFMYIIV